MPIESTAFIVGAGFSANAGLPLQSGFTELFLKAEQFKKGKSRHLMPHLKEFVQQTFGFKIEQSIDLYPELEDLFTMLDLSANTGHHLGQRNSSGDLRSLRRMLLSRIIRMLNSAYLDGKKKPHRERDLLLEFVGGLVEKKHSFVSLNWDVVLEGCMQETGLALTPFYSREIQPVEVDSGEVRVIPRTGRRLLVAKMHGSINWLYCDCCRRTFSVPVDKVLKLASQVLKSDEEKTLYGDQGSTRLACPVCGVDLGVRLATFSYQKAMRTPTFESSWLEAEKSLRAAKKWVFIGYSLPGADFEFKYLLKRVELARKYAPEIVVVTRVGEGKPATAPAVRSYQRFFGGSRIKFYFDGLSPTVIKAILS